MKLVPEAQRHREHCTVGNLHCLTHSIEKLFYFCNECLNMAPSFSKTNQSIYQDNCDLHHLSLCKMCLSATCLSIVLTLQSPSGPHWFFFCEGSASKQMGFSLSYETNLHCYFQNLDSWDNRTQSCGLHVPPFSFLLSFLPPYYDAQKEQGQ